MSKSKLQEPSTSQRFRKDKRTPSWPLRKGIVYDPEKQSVAIRRVKGHRGIESKSHISCKIPPGENWISVFVDQNESRVYAIAQGDTEQEGMIFVGKLNLTKLSPLRQISRHLGNLQKLYIVKH